MSLRGYRKRSLDASGARAAFLVGVISCTASVRFGLTLIAFFASSSKLTKLGAARKREIEEAHQEGGNRNWVQVAANGALGTLVAAAFFVCTRSGATHPELPLHWRVAPVESVLQAAYLCHYACCNADTWASELGVLGRGKPRLITSLRQVPVGTNGGVSLRGTAASVAGGLFIGLVFYAVGGALGPPPLASDPPPPPQWRLLPFGAAAGLVGSMIDSLLGATLQYSGYCEKRRLVVESPGPNVQHISGRNVLDNHQVNFLSSVITTGLGAASTSFLF
mmetsp:Transcript_8914/g.19749  ORF Transcript_8914/g.19749 Transcript_8914/m.19749 type:complete len:278 (+) Transcript_8914:2-835(+)